MKIKETLKRINSWADENQHVSVPAVGFSLLAVIACVIATMPIPTFEHHFDPIVVYDHPEIGGGSLLVAEVVCVAMPEEIREIDSWLSRHRHGYWADMKKVPIQRWGTVRWSPYTHLLPELPPKATYRTIRAFKDLCS